MTNNMNKKLHYVQSEHNPQAMKNLMGRADWKPVNPCPCGAILYPDSHKCNAEDGFCHVYARYEGKIAMAKQLLEYLLNQASAMNLTSETIINVVYVSKMLAMLKELEASQ